MREQGIATPSIAFTTHSASGRTLNAIYDQFHSIEAYQDLWFIWEGKPLVFGDPDDQVLREEVRSYFTIKYSWAWTEADREPDHWQWLDNYPQDYGWSGSKNNVVQVSVSKASHPTLRFQGDSFSQGVPPPIDARYLTEFTGQGLYFQEQWSRAHKLDPQVVMLTQWNEWVAQRQIATESAAPRFLGEQPKAGDTYFVDAFNQEFNRDICPMKEGHTDNHYYLMVDHIRRIKGIAPRQFANRPLAITIDGRFGDWVKVTPVFEDYAGDTLHRNDWRADKKARYTNFTGRNDIVESRVAVHGATLYFYVQTASSLTPHSGKNWMLLFINADQDASTGWNGFDYICNFNPLSEQTTTLAAWQGTNWASVAELEYRYHDGELELAVPLSRLKLDATHLVAFDFQWADHLQSRDNIAEFFLSGDVAPDRRFNYRFETTFVGARRFE